MKQFKFIKNLAQQELMKMKAKRIDAHVLKSLIPSVDFYQNEGQRVRTAGSNLWKEAGICPFHDDKNAGSFCINSVNGAFKCFSCGAKGNDIIDFTEKKYGISFIHSIRKLSCEWGVQ